MSRKNRMEGSMELKVHYKRQMDRNYMVIKGEEGILQPNYEMRMLAENNIQGFMKLSIMQVDCHLEYCYDISSMQPFSRMYQKRKLGLKEVQTLFVSLKREMELMTPYLLEGYHLILQPDYIYIQPQTFQVYFCYHTEIMSDFQQALRELIQFVLENLNHEDQNGIVAVYQMYQRSLEASITIEELLKILFENYETEEEQIEEEQSVQESGNVWKGEIVDSIKENHSNEVEDIKLENNNKIMDYTSNFHLPSKKTLLWEGKKKKQRVGILIASIILFVIALFLIVSNEIWKETEVFFIFLGILAVGLLYNIWNIQQIKQEEMVTYQGVQEKTSGLFVVSYENTSAKNRIEEEYILENSESVNQNEKIDREANLDDSQEVLLGNTGPLQERQNHAFISDNPGLWGHIQMSQYPYVIGRIPDSCNGIINFQEISRLHAEIQKKENEMWIMDLNSLNGTYVNGERLEANTPMAIKTGDKIRFAQISYTFY